MNNEKLVFAFPAFGEKLIQKDIIFYENHKKSFSELFSLAGKVCRLDLCGFPHRYEELIRDELTSQIIAFTYSCAAARVLKNLGLKPMLNCGYSLGLYAALWHAEAFSFESGLKMIARIYNLIEKKIQMNAYGMGVIIGLEKHDIRKICANINPSPEIINVNNKYSFVIAGERDAVSSAVENSIEGGGINSRVLPMKVPFHSNIVHEPAAEFYTYINETIPVHDPRIPVLSGLDQSYIFDKENVIKELASNIKAKLHWENTMYALSDNTKTITFIECGIGKSLTKISKIIEGDYRIISLNSFT